MYRNRRLTSLTLSAGFRRVEAAHTCLGSLALDLVLVLLTLRAWGRTVSVVRVGDLGLIRLCGFETCGSLTDVSYATLHQACTSARGFRFCECFVGGQVVCLWTVRGRLRVYVGPFHNNIGESATVKPYTAVLRGWRRGFTASTGVLRGSSIRLSVEICCRGGRVERHSTGLTRACLRGRLLPPMWVTLTVRTMYVR